MVTLRSPKCFNWCIKDMVKIVIFRSWECVNCPALDMVGMETLRILECFNWGAEDRVKLVKMKSQVYYVGCRKLIGDGYIEESGMLYLKCRIEGEDFTLRTPEGFKCVQKTEWRWLH